MSASPLGVIMVNQTGKLYRQCSLREPKATDAQIQRCWGKGRLNDICISSSSLVPLSRELAIHPLYLLIISVWISVSFCGFLVCCCCCCIKSWSMLASVFPMHIKDHSSWILQTHILCARDSPKQLKRVLLNPLAGRHLKEGSNIFH